MKTNKIYFDCKVDYKHSITTLIGEGFIACKTGKKDFALRNSCYNISVVLVTDDNKKSMSVTELLNSVSEDKIFKPLSLYELLTINHLFPGLREGGPLIIPGFAIISKSQYFISDYTANLASTSEFYVVSLSSLRFVFGSDVLIAATYRTAVDLGTFDGELLEQNLANISSYP